MFSALSLVRETAHPIGQIGEALQRGIICRRIAELWDKIEHLKGSVSVGKKYFQTFNTSRTLKNSRNAVVSGFRDAPTITLGGSVHGYVCTDVVSF